MTDIKVKHSIKKKIVFLIFIVIFVTIAIFIIQFLPFQRRIILTNFETKASFYESIIKSNVKKLSSIKIDIFLKNFLLDNKYVETLILYKKDKNSKIYSKDKVYSKKINGFVQKNNMILKSLVSSNKIYRHFFKLNQTIFFIEISVSSYYKELSSLYKNLIFNAFISILIGIILSFAFVKKIIYPLNKLNETIKSVIDGELTAKINISGGDEFDTIADSFNEMTEMLSNSRSNLVKANGYITNIIRAIGQALLVIDEFGKIRLINPSGCKLLKKDISYLIGTPVSSIFCFEKTLDFDYSKIDYISENELLLIYIYKSIIRPIEAYIYSDYIEIPVMMNCSLIYDKSGHIEGTILMMQDISEFKKSEIEKELLLKKLDKSNKELKQFIYTISHDLKAPLVSIDGFATLLYEKNENLLDEKSIHYVERIKSNILNMNGLMKSILDISRITTESQEFEVIDLKEMILDIGELFSVEFQKNKVDFKVIGDFPEINGIQYQIRQVFENLIYNAFNYRSDEKKSYIEIGYLGIKDNSHHFYVKDNGIGISENNLTRIFEIFTRVGDKEIEGSGVGLAIVKKIIESHSGNIFVESKKGEGSIFNIIIPV